MRVLVEVTISTGGMRTDEELADSVISAVHRAVQTLPEARITGASWGGLQP